MTTTTGDPSSLKTPASLSGGDLVSRLLAATPPYLYNVPLTPHSFFFSEMLRSFVQTKAEPGASTTTSNNPPSVARRRKRSWRDARERPLELTTKDKTLHHNQHSHHSHHHHHHHPHQQTHQQKDKYYPIQQTQQQQQQQQSQQETHAENRFKSHSVVNESTSYASEQSVSKRTTSYEQKSTSYSMTEPLRITDENRGEFCKQSRDFYDDSSRRFSSEQSAHQEAMFAAAATRKIKPEDTQQQTIQRQTLSETNNCDYTTERQALEDRAKMANHELTFLTDQKNKLQEFGGRNFLPGINGIPRLDEQAKSFGLSGSNVPSATDFLPSGPLWYPPYPTIAQSYPGIDPLHFFIDLRVSGHIWDRKMNERQLPFKSKHCSAFSVPQAKEYNRPLDLTRDETPATASSSSSTSRNTAGNNNQRGTHFIMRNLTETYKDIREIEKSFNNIAESRTSSSKSSSSDETTSNKDCQGRSLPKSDISACSSSSREKRRENNEENEGKDLRALIGLELVVDYVKEPKEDPTVDEEKSPDVGE